MHVSEVKKHFVDFSVQSLPYRCPEVLFGVPFNYQIDIWSMGIVLAELCLRRSLFNVKTPHELYNSYCTHLSAPPQLRFAGGKFADTFYESSIGIQGLCTSRSFDFAEHLRCISKLMQATSQVVPSTFINLIAGLLHPDPDSRMTPTDFLQHNFLADEIRFPMSLLGAKQNQRLAEINGSISALRRKRKRSGNFSRDHLLANNNSIITTVVANVQIEHKDSL